MLNRVRGWLTLTMLLAVLVAVRRSDAQINNVTGDQAPPTEGAGHNYVKLLNETVNPGTGSVSLRISVGVPPGRGITVPFAFGYDSNEALHYTAIGWMANSWYLGQAGWSYLLPHLTATVNAVASSNGSSICHWYTDYMLTDMQFASHALYTSVVEPVNDSSCSSFVGAPPVGGLNNVLTGGDAQVQAVTTAPTNSSMTPVKIADLDGTVYSFFPQANPPYLGAVGDTFTILPSSIEDRNGNTITFTSALPVKVTDTLTGRRFQYRVSVQQEIPWPFRANRHIL